MAVLGAALGEAEGAAQLIVHLLRQVRQQVAQIGQRQRVDAHAQLVGAEDAHQRLVIAGAELRQVGHLLQGVVLAVGIHHQHRGAVVRHHQLFQQHAGQVALAAARAGDDGQVGAGEAAHGERHRHRIVGPAEQAAEMCAAGFAPFAPAQHLRQQFVAGDVDRRTAHRRDAWIDKLAQPWIVIAEHRHGQLEEFVGLALVAQKGGHLVGRHARVGHEAVGEELHRAALGHAA